ncbi:MAG: STAS domain-containing protein [Pseudomonadota bacterium]
MVRPRGSIDSKTAGDLFNALIRPIEGGFLRLVLDLGNTTRISRAGSGAIVVATKVLQQRGGEFRLCSMSPDVSACVSGLPLAHLRKQDGTLAKALAGFGAENPLAVLKSPVLQRG